MIRIDCICAIPMFAILMLMSAAFSSAFAQGDLAAERESLRGIESFVVDVTVEGPQHLVNSDQIRRDLVAQRIVHRLQNAGLPVRETSNSGDRDSNLHRDAHLHIHVNMLELDRGLIPFAVTLGFYQDVRILESESEMSSATWQESVLGLVSGDLLDTIPQSIDSLVDQFIDDFGTVNS